MTEGPAGRVVVLDLAGFQPSFLADAPRIDDALDATGPLDPAFPALTVPMQTTLASGQSPGTHGDVASGEYDRERDEAAFWERDRASRTRLWEAARDGGVTTGVLCFQHLIGTDADVAVTPSPIEDENNDFIEMNCWTNPDGFYDDLRDELGHFPLFNYWGPAADATSTEWILDAATIALDRYDVDLLWVYVPHLDYGGLAAGPEGARDAVPDLDAMVGDFLDDLRETERWAETAVAAVSEYGFHAVDRPVFPNRALRDAGLLETDAADDADLPASRAFAMVDHQVAHVYADPDALADARDVLGALEGVDDVLGEEGKAARGVDHPNAGDLVLVADADAWFQYYWWHESADAPAYATEMDIHAKPGFDPCELFLDDDGTVSTDPSRVGGSHGRTDVPAFFGVGGPAAPDVALPDQVDALDVAPTLADLLGVRATLDGVDGRSLLDE